MCVIFLYINPDPGAGEYKVVLVNNRDEMYTRPTKPAHFWNSGILGGMDMMKSREGGTWLGMTRSGRISSLLNIFQPLKSFNADGASRGFLTVDYLLGLQSGSKYMDGIVNSGKVYNPFNLLTLEPGEKSFDLTFYNSGTNVYQQVKSGIHGFGNSPLDRPFQKVEKGLKKFTEVMETYGKTEHEKDLLEELFSMMQDRTSHYPDDQLMAQGEGHSQDHVRGLSSLFVCIPQDSYGTRTTSAILIDQADRVIFQERTMQEPINLDDVKWEIHNFNFTLQTLNPGSTISL